MQRCLELAKLGKGFVAPNPLVGAVLVYDGKIIGEGWHQKYGDPHAEVNCINSVKEQDKKSISLSTLYVSLEPCAHYGKTPPCTDLIIEHRIPKVIIGCSDPFKEVAGKGIEKLKAAGVEVEVGVLEQECKESNKRFLTFHILRRPYIILKWAQTADGKISSGIKERLLVSNKYSNRLAHKWRSEEASILVGTNTALLDDPELTTRLWPGPSPARLVLDMNLRLPSSLKIFDRKVHTIIFNTEKHEEDGNLLYYKITNDTNLIQQIMNALYKMKILSVIVEGGAKLVQSFIDEGIWDELRTITNSQLRMGSGLNSPVLSNAIKTQEQVISTDTIETYWHNGRVS